MTPVWLSCDITYNPLAPFPVQYFCEFYDYTGDACRISTSGDFARLPVASNNLAPNDMVYGKGWLWVQCANPNEKILKISFFDGIGTLTFKVSSSMIKGAENTKGTSVILRKHKYV